MSIIKDIVYKIRGEVTTKELIKRGLVVGKNFKRLNNVIIDDSHTWLITLGDDVTLAPRVHILAHDASTKTALNQTRLGLVNVGNNVFIGAGSIVLPGVTIGDNVVIGAGSTVSTSIPENSLAIGNPAKVVCTYYEYINRKSEEMNNTICFNEEYTIRKNISYKKKCEIIKLLKENGGIGYVE